MQQSTPIPTPEQLEALKCAAAFAYGYTLTIYMKTQLEIYLVRAKALKEDLRAFGCLDENGLINQPYMEHRVKGLRHAELELDKVGLS
jgi:hypothetical protein